MPGVRPARVENIDPDIVELQPLAAQVHLQLAGERFDMGLHHPDELLEAGRTLGQVVERGIGRVALIPMLLAPGAPGLVLLRQHLRGIKQVGIQLANIGQGGAIEFGDEEAVGCHGDQLAQHDCKNASPRATGEAGHHLSFFTAWASALESSSP